FLHLEDAIQTAEVGGADWIHIDVMDGHFVPNITMGPVVVGAVRRATTLPLDVHLMIETPQRYLQDFAKAGADSLTVHVEATNDLEQVTGSIKDLGLRAGIAINPGTPAEQVSEALSHIDLLLVMTVNPGLSGQSFMPEPLQEVERVRELKLQGRTQALIQVDGGIDAHTAPLAARAGAEVFVAASAIFNHEQGIASGIAAIKSSLESLEAQGAPHADSSES
ncbi:MAG: ribulose-phosphate 3-epimerase, partial [Anaerolineales bacterium]